MVDEALVFFRSIPGLHDICLTLAEVGLGYLRLGQSGTTVWAAGWGLTNPNSSNLPAALNEAAMTVANSTYCEITWHKYFSATSSTCYVSPTAATFVSVVVDPGRPSDLYAVGIGAGVWKSTDYGASFTQKVNTGANAAIFDTGNVSQSLSIATNPANPSGPPILYATADVASINGVLISQDGGANWITTMPGPEPFGGVAR